MWLKALHKHTPIPPEVPRKRIPGHLAILFVSDEDLSVDVAVEAFAESVVRAAEWCRTVGIERLTAYDSQGKLIEEVDRALILTCGQESL